MGGAENNAFITLFIILLAISHISLLLNSVIGVNPSGVFFFFFFLVFNPSGFSMKVFHRDSKESPLYPGDHLTQKERLQRLVQQSKNRARYLGLRISSFNKTTNSINPDVARLPLAYEVGSFYVVSVGIGTFSTLPNTFKNYYLMLDPGSELIWTQCQGGGPYFHQVEPLYPSRQSSTFELLQCNSETGQMHPLCYPGICKKGICTYKVEYDDKSSTFGVLAKEKFTVNSDIDVLQSFDIVMGCGLRQSGFNFWGSYFRRENPEVIAGVLGINRGPRSFLSQCPDGKRKFAYCLKPYANGTDSSTYVRFGSDARIGGEGQRVYTTPLFSHPRDPDAYYLNLEDISVGGKKIGFQKKDFEYKEDTGRGGTLMDTGATLSIMLGDQFDRVAERVVAYFRGLDIHPIEQPRGPINYLCFPKPNGDFAYPTVTYHFQGAADFVLDKFDTIFSMDNNEFCLGLLRYEEFPLDFVFGAMQQARKKILLDDMEGSLSFAAEECL